MRRTLLCGLCVLGCCLWPLSAQQQTPTVAQRAEVGASRTALATIADPKNKAIVDVSADDVIVQEAGQAREVLSVRLADYPVVLLVDTGRDARVDFEMVRKAALRFVDRVGERPLAVVTFGDPPKLVATFDDDTAVVKERLGAMEPDPAARSALMEGAALAGRTLSGVAPLFSAMVILSSTGADASAGNPDALVAAVVDSGAILHVVANRAVQTDAPGRLRPSSFLRSLADQTRGGYTVIYSAASYQAALDRLAERLGAELMVEYMVPNGSKPLDVKVGVRLPGARIRGLGVAPK